jgi:PKD repeat protein
VLPVCATGNDDGKPTYTGGVGYPSRFAECMAVAATNWNDAKANYSNYGPQTAVAAPGGASNPTGNPFSLVLSAGHTSNTGYNWRSGTSMAAPQVAGLAALLWATGMHDAAQIRARIIATADDVGAPGWDPQTGAGRINVYRAITGQSANAPPVANAGGAYAGNKGVAVQFDGSGSSDPNGKAITYAWNFGDPTSASNTSTAASPSHTYLRAGTYTVTLTVTDAAGLSATATTQAVIPNIAPAVSALPGATILPGEGYAASGSFSDADPDSWTATVSYGFGAQPLALSGNSFSLAHTYGAAGSFTVTVTVSDDDGGAGSSSATVTVLTQQQGIDALAAMVGAIHPLQVKLDAAKASLDRGNETSALGQLGAFLNQVSAMVQSGQMTAAQGAALTAYCNRIIAAIQL